MGSGQGRGTQLQVFAPSSHANGMRGRTVRNDTIFLGSVATLRNAAAATANDVGSRVPINTDFARERESGREGEGESGSPRSVSRYLERLNGAVNCRII